MARFQRETAQGFKKQVSIGCGREQGQDEAGKDSRIESFCHYLESNGKPLKYFKDLSGCHRRCE